MMATKKKEESAVDRIESLKDDLRQALIDSGQDAGTVDAQLYAIRTPETNVVGNLADLQRLGANVAQGSTGAAAITDAVVVQEVDAEDPTAPATVKETT